jgi:cytochrome c
MLLREDVSGETGLKARFQVMRIFAVLGSKRARRSRFIRQEEHMKASFKLAGVLGMLACSAVWAADVDKAAAESLIKQSGCGKCHSVSAKKTGPAYKETAAKLKDKPGAADELYKHLTTSPTVKVDGADETHPSLKTKNDADVKNVVNYILAQ